MIRPSLLLCALSLSSALTAYGQGTPRLPNLFLVGDLPAGVDSGFNPATIHVQQSQANDMTTREYLRSGRWDQVLAGMKPGDFVVLDFGADNVSAQDRADATRTLAGFGDGTFDYLDPGTHKLELVHSYGWYLRRMVVDVVNHGGTPLLCAGPANADTPGAADWARYIATEQRVPLVPVSADGRGLVQGLRATQPDPLGPYLATAPKSAAQ